MAKASELELFISAVCRMCFESFHDHPTHDLLFAHSNPRDKKIPAVSFDPMQTDADRNDTIRSFFDGDYQFGAMAQRFPWEVRTAIGWVKRSAWLVAAVERNGPSLIWGSYNDTDELSAEAPADPPMMGFDNAGLVRGWLEGRPLLLTTKRDHNDPHLRMLTENASAAIAKRARNN